MTSWATAWSLAVSLSLAPAGTPVEQPADVEAPSEGAEVETGDTEGTEPVAGEPPVEDDLGDALVVEAAKRFVEGRTLFAERRYLEAASAFERSYAAYANGKTLYNIGLSYEKGGDIVRALEAYLRYLDLPNCPAPQENCAARRDQVKEIVLKLRAKVGTLSIVVDEGVELQGVEIDDRMISTEDFPLVLTPGHYELRVRGIRRNEVRTREVEILPGQITSLLIQAFDAPDSTPADIEPRVEDDGGPPPPGRLDEEERRRRLRIAFYSGIGVTVASGVATGVVGGLALQAHNEYEARCRGVGVDCGGTMYPEDARNRVEQLRPVTNALIGVTAGLGITTVVLGLFAFSGKKGSGARASVTRVTPTPGGLRVRF